MIYINSVHESAPTKADQAKEIEKKVKETEAKPMDENATYMEAAFQICIENQRNYNNLMMAIGLDELTYLDREGKEKVYTESGISDFFNKVAAIIQSVWAKIKGMWRTFTTSITSMIKKDEDFINKYASAMEAGSKTMKDKTSEETHAGYKFDGSLNYSGAGSKLTAYVSGIRSKLAESGLLTEADDETKEENNEEKKEEDSSSNNESKEENKSNSSSSSDGESGAAFVAGFRKALCSSATGNGNTFSDECLEHLRGAKVENIFTGFTFDEVKQEILSSNQYTESNNKDFTATENIISAELKKIKELQSSSSGDLNKQVTAVVKNITDANTALTQANAATISALKARYTQAKTIAKRWIVVGKGKNDKEPNKVAADESAVLNGNLLSNLTIM